LSVGSIIPLAVGRFSFQNTEEPASGIVSTGAHNENTSEKEPVSFPLATKRVGNLGTRARHKETMFSGRKHWEGELVL
jgi:hypothetical protein